MKTKKYHVHVAKRVTKIQSDFPLARDVFNDMSFDEYYNMPLDEYLRFMALLSNHKSNDTD